MKKLKKHLAFGNGMCYNVCIRPLIFSAKSSECRLGALTMPKGKEFIYEQQCTNRYRGDPANFGSFSHYSNFDAGQ